ncbi:hypothetical protein PUNSTDRAFT_52095 [Punctularia strigosozonata HHB-11173 SS5]|uniref:uncharacterized protein n=1 Tax=Punctularia strigosozonata (strain HHB-11173) TaxID=741275 RepID=UPI00044183B6|nr:uncharacterized protein PUNSTDRAFT_52095 [Punctularia strigosozonata HHB-11173 SS5]EIN09966.1 hypothetical protein PUNSTDRAFT_52095 [Punctularia strigosozonata HHB-11173 SS5]
MHRALAVSQRTLQPAGRNLVRVSRRRLATAAEGQTAPPKKSSGVRRFLLYTATATATFYIGSAFAAVNNETYHDFFVDNVPLASSVVQFAEDEGLDEVTVESAIESVINAGRGILIVADDVVKGVQRLAGGINIETAVNKTSESDIVDKLKEARDAAVKKVKGEAENVERQAKKAEIKVAEQPEPHKTTLKETVEKAKAKAKAVKDAVVISIERDEERVRGIVRHRLRSFSAGVEELIEEAEAALAGKIPKEPVHEVAGKIGGTNVYDSPLPLGFEPPPGYARPAPPPKPTPAPVAAPAPDPLPLVAPAVAELGASEPVIAQLADVIDNLASYLNSNPTAAEKARDILDIAKIDLTELAGKVDKVKAEEKEKLEATLDEQARQYNLKLLELEMAAQDKLDMQEDEFKKYLEDEKAKFVKAYREKLEQELATQSEIINQRLKEEVIAQGIELQRRWIREVKVRVEEERGGRLAKLDELAANLKRLERVALDNSEYLDENLRVHALWSALRALNTAVDSPTRKPFREELRVLRHFATAKDDPVVTTALETLEATDVPDIGVEPFADLASWFSTSVAPKVASVALVPDTGAGVLSHLASQLLSSFQFKRSGLVEGSDTLSVLARAEYYLNEKDLDSAARELNQLTGTAKLLLSDWLDAARRRLEIQQALEVLQTEATLLSLLVV